MPRPLAWLALTAALALAPLALAFVPRGVEASRRRPVVLLAVYAALVPFGSSIRLPLPLPGAFRTLSTVAGAVAMVSAAAYLLSLRREHRGELPPALPVWLLLLGLTAASILWSVDPGVTAADVVVLTSLVALYAVAVLLPWRRSDLRTLEFGILSGAGATGLYALVLLVTGNMPMEGPAGYRFSTAGGGGAEFGDPNITAATLLLPLALAVARALNTRGRQRAFAIGAGGLIAVALALTGSRGGMVGALLAVMVVAWNERSPRVAVASLAAAAVTVLGVLAYAPEEIGARFAEPTSTGRTDIWETGLRTCPEVCFAGAGYGTFAEAHERQLLQDPAAPGRRLRYVAHNIWLQALVEIGVAGFLLLSLGLALVARGVLRAPRHLRGGALAGLAAVIGSNLFLSNVGFKYFWLALLYATVVAVTPADDDGPPTPARMRAGLRGRMAP